MNPRAIFLKDLFLLLLLSVDFIHAKDSDEAEQVKPIHEFFEASPSDDRFPVKSSTTVEPASPADTNRKSILPMETSTGERNVSGEFKPSVHLGEIKEPKISNNPFNNVHHIKFEDQVNRDAYQERPKDFRFAFRPTGASQQIDHQESFYENALEPFVGSDDGRKGFPEQNNYVKFQDDVPDVTRYQYGGALNDQAYDQHFLHAGNENAAAQYGPLDQQVFQNPEKPVFDQETTYSGRPVRFQGGDYPAGTFWGADFSKKPHHVGFYNHQVLPTNVQDTDHSRKPDHSNNGVVYIQESSFLRTRKFPYPIYQPPVAYHQAELFNEQHPNYSLRNRVSPWKKILHLVGAFLPLGLLVAALTPRVVKVNSTAEPSITLSKWRVNDLPPEHKVARLTETKNACEERSICDTILAGNNVGSTAFQNILWNLATRASTTVAKESGLEEIFEAVKKKDCASIIC